MFNKLGPLGQRIVISGIGFSLVACALFFSFSTTPLSWALPLLSALVFGAAVKEYYTLAEIKGFTSPSQWGVGLAVVYVMGLYFTAQTSYRDLMPLAFLFLSLFVMFSVYFVKKEHALDNLAAAVLAVCYLIIPLGCSLQINYFFPENASQDGRWWAVYLLAITYITDAGAYLIGKNFGRRKFAPYISPQKTWEGAFGGFFLALLASVVFYYFAQESIPMTLSLGQSLVLGSVISLLAQFGDFAESLLKRDAGVKDSAAIPGLGGVLDIVDSLIFPSPFLYLFLKLCYDYHH